MSGNCVLHFQVLHFLVLHFQRPRLAGGLCPDQLEELSLSGPYTFYAGKVWESRKG